MNNEIKCEKCGSIMTYVKQEHTHGYICPNCENCFVTSYFDPIDLDQEMYELIILKYSNAPSKQELKVINTVLRSKNLLQIRKEIVATDYVIKAQARKISEIAKILRDGNIAFTIAPNFPYDY